MKFMLWFHIFQPLPHSAHANCTLFSTQQTTGWVQQELCLCFSSASSQRAPAASVAHRHHRRFWLPLPHVCRRPGEEGLVWKVQRVSLGQNKIKCINMWRVKMEWRFSFWVEGPRWSLRWPTGPRVRPVWTWSGRSKTALMTRGYKNKKNFQNMKQIFWCLSNLALIRCLWICKTDTDNSTGIFKVSKLSEFDPMSQYFLESLEEKVRWF